MTALSQNASPAFHLLAKPTGAICNLDCQYCFFLSKEELYPGSRFRMTDEVLAAYVQQLLDAHQAPEVTVAWQGGEPTLMGLEFFQRSVALVERHKRPGQTVALRPERKKSSDTAISRSCKISVMPTANAAFVG